MPYRTATLQDDEAVGPEEHEVPYGSLRPDQKHSARRKSEEPLHAHSDVGSWLLSASGRRHPLGSRGLKSLLHKHRRPDRLQSADQLQNSAEGPPPLRRSRQLPLPPWPASSRREVLSSMRQQYPQAYGYRSSGRGANQSNGIGLFDDSSEADDAAVAREPALHEAADRRSLRTPQHQHTSSRPVPPRPDDFDEDYDLTPQYQRRFRRSVDRDRPEPDPRPHAGHPSTSEVLRATMDNFMGLSNIAATTSGTSNTAHGSRSSTRRRRPAALNIDSWTWVPPSWSAKLFAFNLRRSRLAEMDSASMPLPGGFLDDQEIPPRYYQRIETREDLSSGRMNEWMSRALEGQLAKFWRLVFSWTVEIALWVFAVKCLGIGFYVVVMAVVSLGTNAVVLPKGW